MTVRVLRAGVFSSVQAAPRVGFRSQGVSPGGALDYVAWRVVNLLLANDQRAAVFEITAGLVRLQFHDRRLVAWAGGEYEALVGGRPLAAGHLALVESGEELSLNGPREGFRAWLAISGGIDCPEVMGSYSTDLKGAFGGWRGRPLQDQDEIPLGPRSGHAIRLMARLANTKFSDWSAPFAWAHPASSPAVLHFVRGKEWETFDEESRESFTSTTFSVAADSDRMGVRLKGAPLVRENEKDLLSEAVAPGTIQVPPGGDPILLLGGCQTIGGYSKLAHVTSSDLPRAAQLRPGDHVIFQEISLAEAHLRLWQLECELDKFALGLEIANR